MRRGNKIFPSLIWITGAAVVLMSALAPAGEGPAPRSPATGPLRICPGNSRYFTDGSGKAIYLTGAHTWNNLVDMGPGDPPAAFDYPAYLNWLVKLNHNFVRMWTWELVNWDTRGNREKSLHSVAPHPWARTGPGKALDGKPRFDLTGYDPDYFGRLRGRIEAAREKGIYVSIMLFEGWGLQFSPEAWTHHPFHPKNNINGIDGDKDGDGKGLEVHTLGIPAITRLQEAYIKKVVDTVNDLDNVLYEISNENHPPSTKWQYHMIDWIHGYERKLPKQHPVGMTFQYRGGKNRTLLESPADWISPNHEGGYRDNPPAADGRKVILTDTDHLWGIGGNQAWVWKSFLRGLNPIFMDPYNGVILKHRMDPGPIRRSLGYTRGLASRVDLASMKPRNGLASTRYCLANPGTEYLVYLPEGGKVSVDLSAAGGEMSLEWMDPDRGVMIPGKEKVEGGGRRSLQAAFQGDAVLYIRAGKSGR